MKNIYLIWIFLVHGITINAQLKNQIGIVNPQLHESTRVTFLKVAEEFEDEGYDLLASVFKSYAEGGHGSGFIFIDEDGNNYIITNRHVVSHGEFVNIEFVDGKEKKIYENCPIIYTDTDIDLAIIQFNNGEKIFTSSFIIDTTAKYDGDEIWSAGFPGLLGKPVWQFAKGNITNNEAFVEELINPEISHVLQHSATIDPGNSGGPLLVKTGNNSFKVVGVNTWSISNRQNTFFAIPSSNIYNVLEKAKAAIELKSDEEKLEEELNKKCKILAAELSSDQPDYKKISQFISYHFVGKEGWESLMKIMENSTEEEKSEWQNNFFNNSPVETMRQAIYYLFWLNIKDTDNKSKVEFKEINISDAESFSEKNIIRTNYIINGVEKEISWIFEHGHWRISYVLMEKSLTKSKFSNQHDKNKTGTTDKNKDPYYSTGIAVFYIPWIQHSNNFISENFNLMGLGFTGSLNFGEKYALQAGLIYYGINNSIDPMPEYLTSAEISSIYLTLGNQISKSLGNKVMLNFMLGANLHLLTENAEDDTEAFKQTYRDIGIQFGTGVQFQLADEFYLKSDFNYFMNKFKSSVAPFGLSDDYEPVNLNNVHLNVGIYKEF